MAKKAQTQQDNDTLGSIAEGLGTLLGTAEKQWRAWQGPRDAVVQAVSDVRDRAVALLSEMDASKKQAKKADKKAEKAKKKANKAAKAAEAGKTDTAKADKKAKKAGKKAEKADKKAVKADKKKAEKAAKAVG